MKFKRFIGVCLIISSFIFAYSSIIRVSAFDKSDYLEVDLPYLAARIEDFCGEKVRTTGTVHFMISYYMYEDFWLGMVIPVVVRFSGLPMPAENSTVEICGAIEYCERIEGGFYYLDAHEVEMKVLPEFTSFVLSVLFILATLLVIASYKRKLFFY